MGLACSSESQKPKRYFGSLVSVICRYEEEKMISDSYINGVPVLLQIINTLWSVYSCPESNRSLFKVKPAFKQSELRMIEKKVNGLFRKPTWGSKNMPLMKLLSRYSDPPFLSTDDALALIEYYLSRLPSPLMTNQCAQEFESFIDGSYCSNPSPEKIQAILRIYFEEKDFCGFKTYKFIIYLLTHHSNEIALQSLQSIIGKLIPPNYSVLASYLITTCQQKSLGKESDSSYSNVYSQTTASSCTSSSCDVSDSNRELNPSQIHSTVPMDQASSLLNRSSSVLVNDSTEHSLLNLPAKTNSPHTNHHLPSVHTDSFSSFAFDTKEINDSMVTITDKDEKLPFFLYNSDTGQKIKLSSYDIESSEEVAKKITTLRNGQESCQIDVIQSFDTSQRHRNTPDLESCDADHSSPIGLADTKHFVTGKKESRSNREIRFSPDAIRAKFPPISNKAAISSDTALETTQYHEVSLFDSQDRTRSNSLSEISIDLSKYTLCMQNLYKAKYRFMHAAKKSMDAIKSTNTPAVKPIKDPFCPLTKEVLPKAATSVPTNFDQNPITENDNIYDSTVINPAPHHEGLEIKRDDSFPVELVKRLNFRTTQLSQKNVMLSSEVKNLQEEFLNLRDSLLPLFGTVVRKSPVRETDSIIRSEDLSQENTYLCVKEAIRELALSQISTVQDLSEVKDRLQELQLISFQVNNKYQVLTEGATESDQIAHATKQKWSDIEHRLLFVEEKLYKEDKNLSDLSKRLNDVCQKVFT